MVPGGVALETLARGRELNQGQKGAQNKPPTCKETWQAGGEVSAAREEGAPRWPLGAQKDSAHP